MPKPSKDKQNPFDVYDFDFTNKLAYMYPRDWSEDKKRKFRALSSEKKRTACRNGGGVYFYNGEELRIMSVPSEIFDSSAN